LIPLVYLLLIWKIDFQGENGLIWITQNNYLVDVRDYGKEKWIYFDEESWEVFLNWEKLWTLPIHNNEFTFFQFLYNNIWKYKTHLEIKEAIIGKNQISLTNGRYLAGIKKVLPNKIKELIKSPPKGYQIEKI